MFFVNHFSFSLMFFVMVMAFFIMAMKPKFSLKIFTHSNGYEGNQIFITLSYHLPLILSSLALYYILLNLILSMHLTKLLGDNASTSMKKKKFKSYFGREIDINASMTICQFLISTRYKRHKNVSNFNNKTVMD